jgi:hypothetical protein
MRILFSVNHLGFLRNFESTLALLAERGHQIHLVTDRSPAADANDGTPIIDRLTRQFPSAFTWETLRPSKHDPWYGFAMGVRNTLNYWRYLSPAFAESPKLSARARAQAPRPVVWLSERPPLRFALARRVARSLFRRMESIIPVRDQVDALFRRVSPDVVLITPLLYFGSSQVDYVRCARAHGIGSILGVGSWDHLTTKGLIHDVPDRIVVWNELQRREAIELHGARAEQVVATGAQPYDHWFATRPSTDRDEFCRHVGLPAERPYLLYLCSSPFIAPYEVDVVERWLGAIRSSRDPRLRTSGVLVRPHPQNAAQWAEIDLSAYGDVAIWPRAGANPIGLDARREYYDSMHHSHAVVGINTSGLIESGIVGRLVYSFRVPELAATQEGTLHFRHLTRNGLLRLADTVEEHVAQLERSFDSADRDRERVRQFIQVFVRPHGFDEPATPRVVRVIEDMAAERPLPERLPVHVRAVQMALHAVLATAAAVGVIMRLVRPGERDGLLVKIRRRVRWTREAVARAPRHVRRRVHSTRKAARRVMRRA